MRKATLHPAALEQLRLFHYFERRLGPFVNLSDLPPAAAAQIFAALREAGTTFASQRAPDYLAIRRALNARSAAASSSSGDVPVVPPALPDGGRVSLAAWLVYRGL